MNHQTTSDSPVRSQQQQQQQQHQEVEEERKKLEERVHGQQYCVSESPDHEYLSFCGCGFLGIYHIGVSSCFNQYAPHLSTKKIAGSSVGALVAVAHICGNLHISNCLNDILQVAIKARARALGPFHPSFNINELIYKALSKGLPDDVHKRASGVLHISLTRVDDGQNVVISEYGSKEDVIQVLICSCFIPFWSGFVPPKFRSVAYMDGGFSNNLLEFEGHSTITVSPFAGEADICPVDDYVHLLQISLCNTSFSISPGNMYRVVNSLLPPPPEALSKLYDQGFNDALRYLRERKQISSMPCCVSPCFPMKADCLMETASSEDSTTLYGSSYSDIVDNMTIDSEDFDDNSSDNYTMLTPKIDINNNTQYMKRDDCKSFMTEGALLTSSDQIIPNKNFVSWLTQSRPVRFLSWITAPCLLPMDVSVMVIQKIWQTVPNIRKELLQSLYNLLTFLQSLVVKRKGSKVEIVMGVKRVPLNSIKSAKLNLMDDPKRGTIDVDRKMLQQKQQQHYSCDSDIIIDGNYVQHTMSAKTRLVTSDELDERLNCYLLDNDNNVNSSSSNENDEIIINKPNSFVPNGSSRLFHRRINEDPLPLESA